VAETGLVSLGRKIAELRGDRSQRDLARASGLDVSTVSRIERGVLDPTFTTLAALARGLGIDAARLLGVYGGVSAMPDITRPDPAAVAGSPDMVQVPRAVLDRIEQSLTEAHQKIGRLERRRASKAAPTKRQPGEQSA
jgi:transcriptional regulator with XRE-family HTH domain